MKKVEVCIDGACEPINPGGTASYGAIVFVDGKEIWRTSKIFIGKLGHEKETSNNVAEYCALIEALNYLVDKKLMNEDVLINSDSQLVVNQMWGTWGMNKGIYIPYAQIAKQLLSGYPNIKGKWIPREENSLADSLSKAELQKMGIVIAVRH